MDKKTMINKDCDPVEGDTEWCCPTTLEGKGEIVPSEPCPAPTVTPVATCTCLLEEECEVHVGGEMTFEEKGCEPHPCIKSIPPKLGCVPINAGVGKWDGGVPDWMNACLTGCDLEKAKECNPYFTQYVMPQGASLLDLNTNPDSTTNLQVIGGGIPRQINIREFFSLAVKLYQTGMEVSGGVNPNNLSLGYVQASDGSLSLNVVADGVAIGNGLALVTETDANGDITAVNLPLPA